MRTVRQVATCTIARKHRQNQTETDEVFTVTELLVDTQKEY